MKDSLGQSDHPTASRATRIFFIVGPGGVAGVASAAAKKPSAEPRRGASAAAATPPRLSHR
eukprot:11958390-Alexandrium_andersonii.AAC.1